MNCIDLRRRYGGRYRVTHDECGAMPRDPWELEIVGKRGRVYPHGGTRLAVEVDGRPRLAAELGRRGYPLHQDGDDEKTFLVPADNLDSLADLLRLPRVRRLTDEQKAVCVERLRQHRFKPRTSGALIEPPTSSEGAGG